MDKMTFSKGIAKLGLLWPNRVISQETTDVYWELLQDLTDEKFLMGIQVICRDVKELYPDTNLVALIREKALGGKQNLQDRAIMAWNAVWNAIRRYGHYKSVQFDDPVIHSCVEALGGWIELCQTDISELHWKEKKFMQIYPLFATQQSMKHPAYLEGWHEQNNRNNGYTSEAMQFITTGKDGQKTEWPVVNPIPEPKLIETGIRKSQKQLQYCN